VLGFSAATLETLTKFPIVTIEKWQGCNATGYTSEEDAMLAAAKTIKDAAAAKGKHVSVVVWFDSFRIYASPPLNPYARKTSGIDCINSRASHYLESSTDHLLKNESGVPVLESFASLHVVDYQKKEMQIYKRDMCLNMTKSGLVDGCGIDGSQQRAGTSAIPGPFAAGVADAWNSGKVCMMNGTTNAIGQGLVLGKLPSELGGVGGYANGILQEGCTNSNATVTNLRAVAQRSRANGNVPLVYECHANAADESSMAAFLVGAGENAYWGFGNWVNYTAANMDTRWLSVFDRKLGSPEADAVYDEAGSMWTRSFGSGTKVTFNARTEVGTIAWADDT